jgi:MoaA/NifB/PqqE/SkfB family radical SAM enzyme
MKTVDKIRIGAQIAASKAIGKPRPFFVQYSLLNACNARCVYCNSPFREDPQLDTQTHLGLLGEFSRLGTARIKFLGGEPLLRNDLGVLVQEVRRLGMRSAMVTSGILIPKRMEVMKQFDEVIISIDGSEQAHDHQRGLGTWKMVMKGIELCAEHKIDFFLSAVVTQKSLQEIDWLLALARDLKVMVNFQIPQYLPEVYGDGARQWLPNPEEIRTVIAKIIAAKEAGAPVLFTSNSYRRTLEWKDFGLERIEKPGQVSPCTAGRYFLQMEPNGDIVPCVLHLGKFEAKNAVRDGVEAAWKHAQNHSCFSCYNTWLNENRAIFDLNPSVLLNFWNNYLRNGAQ